MAKAGSGWYHVVGIRQETPPASFAQSNVRETIDQARRAAAGIRGAAIGTPHCNFGGRQPLRDAVMMKDAADFNWCAERLKALAEPERLRIVSALIDGPRTVGVLADDLDDTIVKVSHHLGVLRHAGVVTSTKQGRFVEYALHPDVFLVLDESEAEPCLDLGCCRLELASKRGERRKRGR
jgi:DNA-binding transcriptional ArsR family regulator